MNEWMNDLEALVHKRLTLKVDVTLCWWSFPPEGSIETLYPLLAKRWWDCGDAHAHTSQWNLITNMLPFTPTRSLWPLDQFPRLSCAFSFHTALNHLDDCFGNRKDTSWVQSDIIHFQSARYCHCLCLSLSVLGLKINTTPVWRWKSYRGVT